MWLNCLPATACQTAGHSFLNATAPEEPWDTILRLLLGLATDYTASPSVTDTFSIIGSASSEESRHLAWQPRSTAKPSLTLGLPQNYECLKSPPYTGLSYIPHHRLCFFKTQ